MNFRMIFYYFNKLNVLYTDCIYNINDDINDMGDIIM